MNKIEMLVLVAVIGLAASMFTGCATGGTNGNVTPAEQVAITTAAEIGTQADLQQRPSDAAYFLAAEQVLSTVATGTNEVSVSTVEAALANSGNGNAASNPAIQTAIAGGLNIADAYLQNLSTTNTVAQQSAALRQVAGWLATGIGEGLSLATTSP